MRSDNFSEYYKTITNSELLDILEHPENYQLAAIEAAKKEFENRQLSEEEIEKAKQLLLEKKLQKEEQRNTIKTIENKVRDAGSLFADTLNPIQKENPSTDKMIRVITITFSVIFLFQVFRNLHFIFMMIKEVNRIDKYTIFYFLILISLLVGILTFWKRKATGWMLLAFFSIYSMTGLLWMLVEAFRRRHNEMISDKLLPKQSLVDFLIFLLILSGILYAICKPSILEVYKINKSRLIATFFMSVLITIFMMVEF